MGDPEALGLEPRASDAAAIGGPKALVRSNARIDDHNASANARIDDLQEDIRSPPEFRLRTGNRWRTS